MNRTYLRISLIPILLVLAALIFPGKSFAQNRYAGVKKVIVVDFYDKTRKFNGAKVADLIRREMKKQSKFLVLSRKGTVKKFSRLNISSRNMLKKSYRLKVGKYTGADAFIIGIIDRGTRSKYVLKLKMERVGSGQVLRAKTFPFNKYIGPNASRAATKRFLGKSGRKTRTARAAVPPPTEAAAPAPSFAPPPEPMETETEEPMAKREIEDEEEDVFAKRETKKKESAGYEEPSNKNDWLTLKIAPAFFTNKYSVKNPAGSTVENLIDVNSGLFPGFYFFAEAWFFRYFGLDLTYDMGFISLDVQPPGSTAFNVKTKFWQMGGSIKGRYPFMNSDRSPYAFLRAGFQMQKFSPTTAQPTLVLSSNRYSDFYIGIGAKVPFWFLEAADVGINFNFDYSIKTWLREHIINNGTSNSPKGYQMQIGPYWKFYKMLFTSFDFYYGHHSATYSAPDTTLASRADAVDGASSSDNVMGMFLSIGANW